MILNMNGGGKDKNLLPENIVAGVEIDGVVGTAPKYDIITTSHTQTITISASDDGNDNLDLFTGYEHTLDCVVSSGYGYTSYYNDEFNRVSPYVLITDIRVVSAIAQTPTSSSTYIDGRNLENVGKDFSNCFFVQLDIIGLDSSSSKNSWAQSRYDLQYYKFDYQFILYTFGGIGTIITENQIPAYFNSTGDRTGGTPFVITIEIDYVKKW